MTLEACISVSPLLNGKKQIRRQILSQEDLKHKSANFTMCNHHSSKNIRHACSNVFSGIRKESKWHSKAESVFFFQINLSFQNRKKKVTPLDLLDIPDAIIFLLFGFY